MEKDNRILMEDNQSLKNELYRYQHLNAETSYEYKNYKKTKDEETD